MCLSNVISFSLSLSIWRVRKCLKKKLNSGAKMQLVVLYLKQYYEVLTIYSSFCFSFTGHLPNL